MEVTRAYGAATELIIPIPIVDDTAFSVSATWTPAAGDVKVSKDGGAAANITTLPVFITDIGWEFALSATEMQAARISIRVVDAAIENTFIAISTVGNASAQFPDSDGSSFTGIPWAAAWDAQVQSEVNDGLVAFGAATAANVAAIRGIPTKNVAFTFQFTMHDATDGFTLEPGITVTEEVSKEGGAFAAAGGTFTEVEEGVYEFAASAGDMNCNYGTFKFTGTGCRPTTINFVTDGGV